MPKRKITVGTSPISNTIYAGTISKDGRTWLSDQTDVTSQVLKAIIDYVGENQEVTVNKDGIPAFKISVSKVV